MPREYDDSGAAEPLGGEQPREVDPDATAHEPSEQGELTIDSRGLDQVWELEDPSWIDSGDRPDAEHYVLRPQSGQELSELCNWLREHSNEFFEGSTEDRVVLIYGIEESGPVAKALREELAKVGVAVGFPGEDAQALDRAAVEARHERLLDELKDEQELRQQVIEGVAKEFAEFIGEPSLNHLPEGRELEPDVEVPFTIEGGQPTNEHEQARDNWCSSANKSEELTAEIHVARPQDQPPQAPVHQVDIWCTAFVGLLWISIRWYHRNEV